MYLAKNTSQSASVEFGRPWRTNYARGRLQAFCSKRATPFLNSLKRAGPKPRPFCASLPLPCCPLPEPAGGRVPVDDGQRRLHRGRNSRLFQRSALSIKNVRLSRTFFTACQESLAEFAARRRQIKCNPFFAGACIWQKILLSLQVWNLFAAGKQIMRAADCKPFVQKGLRPFWAVSKNVRLSRTFFLRSPRCPPAPAGHRAQR